MKKINVLSLFDGMSCGQLAISQLGFNYNYYASEIDKHAMQVTQANFPNTVQLGSVEHWQLWDIGFASIDLLIGGSPCQGFSFAGKQLNFDDPRSKLFFVYVDILNYIRSVNPNVKFLLENVKMKKEYEAVISEHLGVKSIEINSNLVSAQNRKRLYWTNIEGVTQPEDRGIYLKDILQEEVDEKYYLSDKGLSGMLAHKERNTDKGNGFGVQFISEGDEKANTVLQRYYKDCKDNALCVPEATKKGYAEILPGECFDNEQPNGKTRRGRRMTNKSNSLMAQNMSFLRFTEDCKIRRLTPIECERLQTVPDNYTASVSDTQRYRMLGNGWTVEVIKHILKKSESMRYLGSKGRIASKLLTTILKNRKPGQYYVELFCGGCNMIDKVENPRIAADVNPLLIAMWEDFQAGRIFPSSISKADYDTAYVSYKSMYYGVMDMALVCWIGFNASFRGKFFAGYSGAKTSEHIDGAIANIMRQAEKLSGVEFRCGSYRSVPIPERSIVYLDPPYRNTTGYRTEAFDYDDFYCFCFELWEQGHTVFMSEYSMPIPFKEVLSIELSGGIKNSNKAIEKLYTL